MGKKKLLSPAVRIGVAPKARGNPFLFPPPLAVRQREEFVSPLAGRLTRGHSYSLPCLRGRVREGASEGASEGAPEGHLSGHLSGQLKTASPTIWRPSLVRLPRAIDGSLRDL